MATGKLPDPGELDQEIDIMQDVGGTDEMGGGTDPSTTPVFTGIAAMFRRPRSREIEAAQTMQDRVDWYVTVFYRDGIESRYWIRHRGKRYEIAGEPVDINMARIYLEMPVKHIPSRDPV